MKYSLKLTYVGGVLDGEKLPMPDPADPADYEVLVEDMHQLEPGDVYRIDRVMRTATYLGKANVILVDLPRRKARRRRKQGR